MTNRHVSFLPGLLRLFAAVCLGMAVVHESLVAAGGTPNEVTIVSAIWGAGTQTADVTTQMAALVHPRSGNVVVNTETLGVDPAPGKAKELMVEYRFHDTPCTITFRSGQTFNYQTFVKTASSGAAPAATGAALIPTVAPQILSDAEMTDIVLIEGDRGAATGFIARVRDKDCVVTNLHVLGASQKYTIKNLAGEVVAVQGIIGAVGADIVLLPLVKPTAKGPTLAMADKVLQTAKIGDKVVVVGNRMGGGVATQTSGQLKGIGPTRIEVSAAFQSGNSGSPIFDLACKQVIGVASYIETVSLDALNNSNRATGPVLRRETRWFGYRLDSVADWEDIEWIKWRGQMQRVDNFRAVSLDLLAVAQGHLSDARHNPRLRAMIDDYEAAVRVLPRGKAAPDKLTPARTLLRAARTYAEEGARDFPNHPYYDYFRNGQYWETSVPEQARFRDQLIVSFTDIDADIESYQRRL